MKYLIPLQICVVTAALSPAIANAAPHDTRTRLTELRDSFVQKTQAAGLHCPIAAPKIVLTDTASFGSYEPKTNTLQTPTWKQLSAAEKAFFFQLAGAGADQKAAESVFEYGTHRWVFVHELGHWWQACTKANENRQNYAVEYDANRIAAAFWRAVDPSLMARLDAGFQKVIDDTPSPVASGQTPESFFNDHYTKLAGTPAYTWFQAQMITSVAAENPLPSFNTTLEETR